MTRLRATRGTAAVVLCLGLAGCGGSSSPSGPSATLRPTPIPTPVAEAPSVIDGWTDQPVTAEATPTTVLPGHGVVVRAPGYLAREQIYTREPVALWPADVDYVRELVYGWWEFSDGVSRMVRWTEPFTITLEGPLAEDEAVLEKALDVARELTRRTGLPISVGPGGACRLKLDRTVLDRNAVAAATLSVRGASITGATVTFAYRDEILGGFDATYQNTLLHEMGHVIGLAHSLKIHDVMTPGRGAGTYLQEFHSREATVLHMMYFHREPGNSPPDRDPQLGMVSLAPPLIAVIRDCRPPSASQR